MKLARTPDPNNSLGSRSRKPSKLDLLENLLRSPDGMTIADAVKETGWQAHSVRGALSGALAKRAGAKPTSAKEGGVLVYQFPAT